ncbi:MAG: hypothetical protein IJQ96_02625, partial [Bacteroidales bacterium]|nr:hypothetical protein [Bacteroidales bacterium]
MRERLCLLSLPLPLLALIVRIVVVVPEYQEQRHNHDNAKYCVKHFDKQGIYLSLFLGISSINLDFPNKNTNYSALFQPFTKRGRVIEMDARPLQTLAVINLL